MTKYIAAAVLSFGICASANAGINICKIKIFSLYDSSCKATLAPEIDPASAMSALTLLAGGLVLVRGRRGKRPE